LTSADAVSEKTQAGTGCGSCKGKLEKILETMDHWHPDAGKAASQAQQAA
jgi:nitrogenase molybdenum-cofactor synthesis protein NifE